ncbi:MAG: transporter substrate-binding domain-containing protein [Bacteroidales bacterium]|nr:transporter substrate-binding domain-containing protein [Bacteroidales bacterium]
MLILAVACSTHTKDTKNQTHQTHSAALDEVLANRKLKVLTEYNSVNYYIYRGEPMGYQYEMLQTFCRNLGVRLEIRIENNLDQAKEKLAQGQVHLLAFGLTVTKERQQQFDFTDPIAYTRQVLIQRLPDNWRAMLTRDQIENQLLRNTLDLAEKTIVIQEGSIYKKRLETLMNEIADTIYVLEDQRDVEELIAAVASGDIDFTVADEYIATQLLRTYDNLDSKTPLSFQQKIAWAVRKEPDNELLYELNSWLNDFYSSTESRLLYSKYFAPEVRIRSRSEFHSLTGAKISPYDEEIREAAKTIGWDWRLLASLIYQESEFKPASISWAGAYGLMQMMPSVMEQFNVDTASSPEEHIMAGAKYLMYLDKLIPETVTDKQERIKFILAAYNAGTGHVLDARRLAEKYNKNKDIWTENVDFFLRNKSKPAFYNDPVSYYGYVRGEETYQFVEQILERYEHYRNLLPE